MVLTYQVVLKKCIRGYISVYVCSVLR